VEVRNLVLTGGIFHPFEEAAPALAALLEPHGIRSTVTQDIEDGLAVLTRGEFDLLTIYALRWRMEGDEKYAPYRDRWAFSLSADGRAAIKNHLAGGGGILGLHTAVICFDDWPEWGSILGGAWEWGQSGHPPLGTATVRIDEADDPIVRGLPDFKLQDEVYGDLNMEPGVRPIASATADKNWHPVLWTRQVGDGRVAFDGLGHDADSINHPVHRRILKRAALWAAGASETEILET
jgi:type 1 glutamine amidotransferase